MMMISNLHDALELSEDKIKEQIEKISTHNVCVPTSGRILHFSLRKQYNDIESERIVNDTQGNIIPYPP